jgi:hypothetical protein
VVAASAGVDRVRTRWTAGGLDGVATGGAKGMSTGAGGATEPTGSVARTGTGGGASEGTATGGAAEGTATGGATESEAMGGVNEATGSSTATGAGREGVEAASATGAGTDTLGSAAATGVDSATGAGKLERSGGSCITSTKTGELTSWGGTIDAGVGALGAPSGGTLMEAAAAVGITLETWPRSSSLASSGGKLDLAETTRAMADN